MEDYRGSEELELLEEDPKVKMKDHRNSYSRSLHVVDTDLVSCLVFGSWRGA